MQRYKEILFYTAKWCGTCHRAKYWLDEHNIPYTVVDIDELPQKAVELEAKTGKRGIPFLVLDGEWIRGYTPGAGVDVKLYEKLFAAYV